MKLVGKGSSRRVYDIGSGKVLKLAFNVGGLAQNEAEVDTFQKFGDSGVFAEIFDFDPNFKRVVMERAETFRDQFSFKRAKGVPFTRWIDSLTTDDGWKALPPEFQEEARSGRSAVLGSKLTKTDLNQVEHWGTTPDGRVVLIDYGTTSDVVDKYYATAAARIARDVRV